MFGFGKVTCAVCGSPVSEKQALRGKHRREVGACRTCYENWERSGKSCAGCRSPVQGAQELGVVLDRPAFGHADCGAVWLTG
jgi:predicted amidophosphoribosyltransferase